MFKRSGVHVEVPELNSLEQVNFFCQAHRITLCGAVLRVSPPVESSCRGRLECVSD